MKKTEGRKSRAKAVLTRIWTIFVRGRLCKSSGSGPDPNTVPKEIVMHETFPGSFENFS
jgi:hypothetical protein